MSTVPHRAQWARIEKAETRAKVIRARVEVRTSGGQAKVKEGQVNISSEKGQEEYHRWKRGASTVQNNGTRGISNKVGIRDGHNNNNNNNGPNNNSSNGPSNNNSKRRQELEGRQRDHRERKLKGRQHLG